MNTSNGRSKVAIVTGGARGIGAAVCECLAREGWRVVAADVAADDGAHSRDASIEHTSCDVSREGDVRRLVADALQQHGRIDAIVSNAGISANRPLKETTLDDWNRVLGVNLTAAFLLAREAEGALRDSSGAMILIASTRAHMSEPDTVAYSASKGGLVALTHALAVTMAPVRVNCISPGWIDTGRHGTLREADHAQHPAGRVGRPDDIAAAVSYLLGDGAGFVTGTELVIDGGMTRKMIYA
ncbi:MAG: SDR family oxidoreductase [Hyphomicrobiales bacterium]|nr:SDR family oxidoreductase [Hyphomicrobiales bacterium]